MNPRIAVTASLLPLAALAAVVAPVLMPATHSPPPVVPTATATAQVDPTVADVPVAPVDGPAGVHLTVTPDRSVLYADGDRRMRIRVDWWADQGDGRTTTPTDLVVVLDRSGSMNGTKILDARAAAAELVSLLGPEDRFGLVSFSSDVRIDVPLTATHDRTAWTRAIDGLRAAGGTGMVDGLTIGLSQVAPTPGRSRRVVLISDGLPDSPVGLDALADGAARSETPLSTIGIGVDYDEALMQSIADRGTGNFYWTERGPELQQVLAAELSTARETVATGVRIRSTGGARIVDAGGLPVGNGTVDLGTLYAGQRRSLWLTVEVPATPAETVGLGTFTLAYSPSEGKPVSLVAVAPAVTLTRDARVAFSSLGDTWADSVVTEEFNRLRTAVSASVQAGDQEAATQAIDAYRLQNASINAHARNATMTDNLRDLDTLEADVNAQFEGEDQAGRQNMWSKGTRVDAYRKRRVGQVMPSPMPSPR